MPIEVGTLTIIDPNGEESRDMEPLNRLPHGAWKALTTYLYRRVMEQRDHLTVYAPDDERLQRWYAEAGDRSSTFILAAVLNGLAGGIALTYQPHSTYHDERWTVTSHT